MTGVCLGMQDLYKTCIGTSSTTSLRQHWMGPIQGGWVQLINIQEEGYCHGGTNSVLEGRSIVLPCVTNRMMSMGYSCQSRFWRQKGLSPHCNDANLFIPSHLVKPTNLFIPTLSNGAFDCPLVFLSEATESHTLVVVFYSIVARASSPPSIPYRRIRMGPPVVPTIGCCCCCCICGGICWFVVFAFVVVFVVVVAVMGAVRWRLWQYERIRFRPCHRHKLIHIRRKTPKPSSTGPTWSMLLPSSFCQNRRPPPPPLRPFPTWVPPLPVLASWRCIRQLVNCKYERCETIPLVGWRLVYKRKEGSFSFSW